MTISSTLGKLGSNTGKLGQVRYFSPITCQTRFKSSIHFDNRCLARSEKVPDCGKSSLSECA
jgi:hypothetical protein